ncbi:DUF3180 domain-containing protein [Rothia halotolerans]|uniref:DUF3180 domain-containing protein n=1 Tax=Rothia halotolerans TaxID=405770 RepID=UPI00101BE419|nr:DUF3180 domain-containing protein [Rothia halotolerans]
MKPLKVRWLVLVGALGLALGAVANSVWDGGAPLVLPWFSLLVSVFLGAAALVLAWRVRAHIREPRKRRIDPILASRIVVFAQACAVYGALLTGWGLGALAHELTLVQYRGATSSLLLIVLNGAVGLAVGVAGAVAESWCKRPPEDPGEADDPYAPQHPRGDRDAPEGEGGYARDRERPRGPRRGPQAPG